MEKEIKAHLQTLLVSGEYDAHDQRDRKLVAYFFIPVLQRECNTFVRLWNSHRIRQQRGLELPTGIPNHMYAFPEQYGAEQKGIPLSEEEIIDVAEEADIGHSPMAYISDNDHDEQRNILEEPEKVLCKDLISNYRLLKQSQAIKD